MFTLAICSTCGGVGRTTITAGLASALGRRGHRVLAIDLDPQNMLGRHLGINSPSDGLATSPGDAWIATSWHTSDGVDFVPFGNPTSDATGLLETNLRQHPEWLHQRLDRIDFPDEGIAIIDSARLPSCWGEVARHAADLTLFVGRPEPLSLGGFDTLSKASESRDNIAFLLNDVDPTRTLHRDALLLARNRWPQLCLQYPIHRDEAMAEALAHGQSIFDYATRSQAAHDLHGVTEWLLSQLQLATR